MTTEAALQAKTDAEVECIRRMEALVNAINVWPEGRRKVAETIAEAYGWTTDGADETYIQPALDALAEYKQANDDLLQTFAAGD